MDRWSLVLAQIERYGELYVEPRAAQLAREAALAAERERYACDVETGVVVGQRSSEVLETVCGAPCATTCGAASQ